MKHVIVKVGLQGEVYWGSQWMNFAAFKKALSELKAEDGYLTYYREAPDEEPSKAVVQTFKAIVDSQNKIQIGHDAPSEWGTLESFEIEEAPHRFRFSLERVCPVLFTFVPEGGDEGDAGARTRYPGRDLVQVGGPLDPIGSDHRIAIPRA